MHSVSEVEGKTDMQFGCQVRVLITSVGKFGVSIAGSGHLILRKSSSKAADAPTWGRSRRFPIPRATWLTVKMETEPVMPIMEVFRKT